MNSVLKTSFDYQKRRLNMGDIIRSAISPRSCIHICCNKKIFDLMFTSLSLIISKKTDLRYSNLMPCDDWLRQT